MYFFVISTKLLVGIHCGEPYRVPNSKRRVAGHYYNDSVIYDCILGYVLSGSSKSVCQLDGHWSVPPECNGKYM